MIPGTTTKMSESTVASAATVEVKSDLVLVTGTTSISTLNPHFGGGFSGICVLTPTAGTISLLTTGNIAIAVVMAQNRATVMVYCKSTGVWYPGAIS